MITILSEKFPAASTLMEQGRVVVLACTTIPPENRPKILSTNPLERLNREIKRRTSLVGIFPQCRNDIRLVSALLLEQQEQCQLDARRVFSELSMAKLDSTSKQGQDKPIAALAGAA